MQAKPARCIRNPYCIILAGSGDNLNEKTRIPRRYRSTNDSVMKSERSSLVRDSDLPKCRSAHTPVGAMWRRLGRTNWQGGEISQAGKHTSSMRRYDTKNEMKNMLYFVETTHEVAETVIFQKYVPEKSRLPILQNEDSSCSIGECNASNTASTPKISDVCTAAAAAAVDTAYARGSVLLKTSSMSIRTRALSLETIIFRIFALLLPWILLVLGALYC